MDFKPGDRVGDLEVRGLLGAGGMGQVYKVRNTISCRTEALKVILVDSGDANAAQSFAREIRVHATLNHPNIAAVRSAHNFHGQPVMVLEYVQGETMEAVLRRGPMPMAAVVHYATQLLDALEYAHQRGIVHCDIKPSNIMIDEMGRLKLMDFGIARSPTADDASPSRRAAGSIAYMSPEQVTGCGEVTCRSDVYQVGLCLYECLTGMRPFPGNSDYAIAMSRLRGAAATDAITCVRGPARLKDVILRALRSNPADRYPSAAAFKHALLDAVACDATAPAACGAGRAFSRLVWLAYASLGFTTAVLFSTLVAVIWTALGFVNL
jgi:serine/threonine-protein kinase